MKPNSYKEHPLFIGGYVHLKTVVFSYFSKAQITFLHCNMLKYLMRLNTRFLTLN
jgi:hypothetical protein